jgi:hypothetical protein
MASIRGCWLPIELWSYFSDAKSIQCSDPKDYYDRGRFGTRLASFSGCHRRYEILAATEALRKVRPLQSCDRSADAGQLSWLIDGDTQQSRVVRSVEKLGDDEGGERVTMG